MGYIEINKKKSKYISKIDKSEPGWPSDVCAIYDEINKRLFDFDVEINDVMSKCGCRNNNIYTRFRHFVGRSPKEYMLHHRIELAKRLLEIGECPVSEVAFTVGYASPAAFSQTFKSWVGISPSKFKRECKRD